ncbi:MAG: S9 family peptidase, partial [Bryobacteraceae bacterium]|nr:S9 family peptidase [Bryobacteraceae bacterium]
MRWIVPLLACAALGVQAEGMPSLETLFTRPYIWGSSPTTPRWSKNGDVLVFLWNSDGRRFRDLYAWHVAAKKLVRLTDLESTNDELNFAEEEKDERRKLYLPPAPGLASFDIASDGNRVAFSYKGDLWIATADGSIPLLRLTKTKGLESAPRFSPDGMRLTSLRGGQLIVQNLANGQIWQATDIETGSLAGYEWSPDGKTLLCRIAKGAPRQLPLPNYSGRTVTARTVVRSLPGDDPPEVSLVLLPVEGGKARPIDRGGDKWSLNDTVWSPDSRRILISQSSPDHKKRQLLTVETATAKAVPIFGEEDLRWVDSGFAGWSQDSSETVFTSERDGWAHLYRVKATGGEPVQITRGGFEVRTETFSQDPQWAGGYIYYSSNEGDTAQRQFYRVRPDGSGKEKLSSGDGMHIGVVSEDGRNVAMLQASETAPFDLWVNGARVTTSPRRDFANVPWPRVRYVKFSSKVDGKAVAAKILLPPGYDLSARSAKKWPAVVYVHGAGIATSVLKQWGSYNEFRYVFNAWLTSRGYVVLDLDYRGSTGYGRDWRSDVYLNMGGKDLDDVVGAVDYLRSLANVDTDRLGIWG